MYKCAANDSALIVTQYPVQQQSGSTDCGLFSIAFAYHAAFVIRYMYIIQVIISPTITSFNYTLIHQPTCSALYTHLAVALDDSSLLLFSQVTPWACWVFITHVQTVLSRITYTCIHIHTAHSWRKNTSACIQKRYKCMVKCRSSMYLPLQCFLLSTVQAGDHDSHACTQWQGC